MSGGSGDERVTQARRDLLGYIEQQPKSCAKVAWTDSAGVHHAKVEGRAVVGSASGVDVVVSDPMVSRLHAELEHRPDGLWVRDLGSTNGTRVNGVRVESACVPDGASLLFGSTTLVVNPGAASTSIELWPIDSFGPLVGKSTVMRALFARLARIAATDSTVLIEGETGTGKDMVAHALHEASPRVGKPMVVVDCAALPENLLEAELFGHAKGAFTGAGPARSGAIESADGSTVLLDEVGELPLSMQPKLLRAIESRTVRRLGETAYRTVDVRFVSATNRDLRRMVNVGAFREDLYFRLAVVPVSVPPLREHAEDIEMLVEHFLPAGASELSSETLEELVTRPWLGNVRELRNFVERAQALGAMEALALLPAAESGQEKSPGRSVSRSLLDLPLRAARERWVEQLEREYIGGLLERHGGNVAQVAEAAGVDKSYIHRLIRRNGL
jgi:transcriptional regulator with GAF, ATPase, and Fis domain